MTSLPATTLDVGVILCGMHVRERSLPIGFAELEMGVFFFFFFFFFFFARGAGGGEGVHMYIFT